MLTEYGKAVFVLALGVMALLFVWFFAPDPADQVRSALEAQESCETDQECYQAHGHDM